MSTLNYTSRKGMKCSDRMHSSHAEKVDDKKEIKEPVKIQVSENVSLKQMPVLSTENQPIKISRVLPIEVEFGKEIKCDEVDMIIEFENGDIAISHPTKVEYDTSVLGEREAKLYFKDLMVKQKVKVIRPAVVE